MLRTFKKGLGREMKAVWEENLPGEWEKMLRAARVRAGTMIDDDEFAIKLAAENLTANRVFSKKMLDASGGFTGYQAEFAKAIQTNQWSGPQSLGEMRALNLDAVAERISLRSPRTGRDYETSMQLREGLASGDLDIDDIRRALRDLDADPDYIARVDQPPGQSLEFQAPRPRRRRERPPANRMGGLVEDLHRRLWRRGRRGRPLPGFLVFGDDRRLLPAIPRLVGARIRRRAYHQ
jgi:hypothetical protein